MLTRQPNLGSCAFQGACADMAQGVTRLAAEHIAASEQIVAQIAR